MIGRFISRCSISSSKALPADDARLAHMKAQKWGRIVNITSEVYQRAVAPFSAYVAAKAGRSAGRGA